MQELEVAEPMQAYGLAGEYYRTTDSLGLKVYRKHFSLSDLRANAACQWIGQQLLLEASTLVKVPNLYEIVKVRQADNAVRLGQLMEHIDGTHYEDLDSGTLIDDSLKLALAKTGIELEDLHESNIIDTGKELYIVDWEARYVVFSKPVKKALKRAAIERFSLGEWETSLIFSKRY